MQNLHNTIFCQISATEDIIYPFYQHNPPQEILQMFRNSSGWFFPIILRALSSEDRKYVVGLLLGIFICSAEQRREWRNTGGTEKSAGFSTKTITLTLTK
jgi:hypothetical protein